MAERLEGITDFEKGWVHERWARDFQDIWTIRNWGLDRETRVSLRSLLDVYSDVQELTQSHCESYTRTHLPPSATSHARAGAMKTRVSGVWLQASLLGWGRRQAWEAVEQVHGGL